jgi:hypothetical protein
MMRSLLVAIGLLTSAGTAYAECAWVLWQGTSSAWTGQPVDNLSHARCVRDARLFQLYGQRTTNRTEVHHVVDR